MASFWRDRPVFVTGHTGFKGGWLTLWLRHAGARVHGFALDAPTDPSFFDVVRLEGTLASHTRADLADLPALVSALEQASPDVIFHLAAQPLVRESYRDPLRTLASNVLGTAHVLEAARRVATVRAIVLITTDKVYENRENARAYQESDPLGGHDPYSASKAAAEIVGASYRASFFGDTGHPACVATARARNVIGGGDWAAERLVPDCLRAFAAGTPVQLRYPNAVRPWQHVLEPLSGYLRLAEGLAGDRGNRFATAWNFGPDADGDATVSAVAGMVAAQWGGGARVDVDHGATHPHEAECLRLDTTRARRDLGWAPRWPLERAIGQTVEWHRAWMARQDMTALTLRQIEAYETTPAR